MLGAAISPEAWLAIAAVASIAILGVLHTFASTVRQARRIHDLKIECISLRNAYVTRMQQLGGLNEVDEIKTR